MIDLKRKEKGGEEVALSENEYPWGTRISLDDEHLSGISGDFSVGDEVMIIGLAKVVSHSENEDENNSHESMSFQITEIDIQEQSKDRVKSLYDV